jgi:hypothetical protein
MRSFMKIPTFSSFNIEVFDITNLLQMPCHKVKQVSENKDANQFRKFVVSHCKAPHLPPMKLSQSSTAISTLDYPPKQTTLNQF